GEQGGHNGLPQLVFHDRSPVGDASGVIMDTNCFSLKGFRSVMQKAVTLRALRVLSARSKRPEFSGRLRSRLAS
ncbi:MAG TPA: hypothetical protein VH682_26510, partial [Gemmataceae bacterium]